MADRTFNNLEEARKEALLASYEGLFKLKFGSQEFLNGAQAINNLEKALSERYKADSDYEGKVKSSEIESDLRRDLAEIESNTKEKVANIDAAVKKEIANQDVNLRTDIARIDFEIKEKIANDEINLKKELAKLDSDNKENVALIDAAIRKEICEQDIKAKERIACIEDEGKSKDRKAEMSIKTIEAGAKMILLGAQLLIFMEELSKSRKFEETGVEVSSAFRKLWSTFKPFNVN